MFFDTCLKVALQRKQEVNNSRFLHCYCNWPADLNRRNKNFAARALSIMADNEVVVSVHNAPLFYGTGG